MDAIATTPPQALGGSLTPAQRIRAQEAARDFEAFYITQFISLMKPQNEDTQFNGGVGERMFRQELNSELGKAIARQGGFGIGDKVYAELLKQQEAASYGAR